MKKLALSIVLLISSFIAFLTSAFGWLSIYKEINKVSIGGGITTGYFAGGDGTADDPYILTNATHVYNLAWLQYMGEFNKEENGKIEQTYFKVNDGIDLGGMIIPPIGTTEYPFVGNFNGNGHAITNFQVANYVGDKGITQRPPSVTAMGEESSVVGFFGVIGDWNDKYGAKIETSVNKVEMLYLGNFTVSTITEQSLIGLLAGYVNGSVSQVGVGESAMQIGKNVKPLAAETAAYALNALSLYSLVGNYNADSVVWGDVGGGSSGGDGAGFGGSMNMYDLTRRLTYMFTENVIVRASTNEEKYPVVFYGNDTSYFPDYMHSSGQRTSYILEGSVIPLNVDKKTMFEDNDTIKNTSYRTNGYYSTHDSEIVLNTNTGYIVGGGTGTSDSIIRTRIAYLWEQSAGTPLGITNSFNPENESNVVFSRDGLQCLTIVPTWNGEKYVGTTKLIDDGKYGREDEGTVVGVKYKGQKASLDDLNLSKYESVLSAFAENMADKKMIYGLRFVGGYDIGTLNPNMITTSPATITGKSYSDYQMLEGAINFHLEQSGVITTLAGTYASSGTQVMFSLYKIARDGNGNIINGEDTFEIKNIWVNQENVSDIKYNLETGTTPDGYRCAYDSTAMRNLTEDYSVYYFELPVLKGDYALTTKRENPGENGAYLMYLDIGANAGGSGDGEGTTTTQEITGVNFIDEARYGNNSGVVADDYPLMTYQVALKNPDTTTHNGLTVAFNERESATEHTYTTSDTSGAFVITASNDSGAASAAVAMANVTRNVKPFVRKEECA